MTPQELATCTGARIDRAAAYLPYIKAAMVEYGINTSKRKAAFLAQIGHESGGLHYSVEVWGPTDAQSRYEGREDLGNTHAGDGFKFRGRGLMQITGRANYRTAGEALGVDFIACPERLGMPEDASRSAGWFWKRHGLNEQADIGDFRRITRRINGGFNGYAERCVLWEAAKKVLNV